MIEQFDLNLSRLLAHTLWYEAKQAVPAGVVDDFRNADDSEAKSVGTQSYDLVQSFTQALPTIISEINAQTGPTAKAQYEADATYSPKYTALQTALYNKYGPQLAETAQKIDAANKLAGAQADLAVLNGPGQGLVEKSIDLSKLADPEYYKLRSQASDTISQLMSGSLTDAEREEIARSNAAGNVSKGLAGVPSNINTVANAMTFGQAARERQTQGAQLANSFLPVSRSGIDSNTALGRSSINTGDSKFNGVGSYGQGASNTANNLMSGLFGMSSDVSNINANRRDTQDRVMETINWA